MQSVSTESLEGDCGFEARIYNHTTLRPAPVIRTSPARLKFLKAGHFSWQLPRSSGRAIPARTERVAFSKLVVTGTFGRALQLRPHTRQRTSGFSLLSLLRFTLSFETILRCILPAFAKFYGRAGVISVQFREPLHFVMLHSSNLKLLCEECT
jgi:hypothetical protein